MSAVRSSFRSIPCKTPGCDQNTRRGGAYCYRCKSAPVKKRVRTARRSKDAQIDLLKEKAVSLQERKAAFAAECEVDATSDEVEAENQSFEEFQEQYRRNRAAARQGPPTAPAPPNSAVHFPAHAPAPAPARAPAPVVNPLPAIYARASSPAFAPMPAVFAPIPAVPATSAPEPAVSNFGPPASERPVNVAPPELDTDGDVVMTVQPSAEQSQQEAWPPPPPPRRTQQSSQSSQQEARPRREKRRAV